MKKTKNIQINLSFPEHWRSELEHLARVYSVEEEKTLTMHDLIRIAMKEKYGLDFDGK